MHQRHFIGRRAKGTRLRLRLRLQLRLSVVLWQVAMLDDANDDDDHDGAAVVPSQRDARKVTSF